MNALQRKTQVERFAAIVAGDPCFEHKAAAFLNKRAWSPEHAGVVDLSEIVAVCAGIDENRARHYLLAAGFVRAPDGGQGEGKERWMHQPWYLLPWPAPESAPVRATRRGTTAAATSAVAS
jgi:hypothetical protein